MKRNLNKIWYATYGSNLHMERFLCYIRGGQPKGRTDVYKGCRNKTLPEANEEFYISSRLALITRNGEIQANAISMKIDDDFTATWLLIRI